MCAAARGCAAVAAEMQLRQPRRVKKTLCRAKSEQDAVVKKKLVRGPFFPKPFHLSPPRAESEMNVCTYVLTYSTSFMIVFHSMKAKGTLSTMVKFDYSKVSKISKCSVPSPLTIVIDNLVS